MFCYSLHLSSWVLALPATPFAINHIWHLVCVPFCHSDVKVRTVMFWLHTGYVTHFTVDSLYACLYACTLAFSTFVCNFLLVMFWLIRVAVVGPAALIPDTRQNCSSLVCPLDKMQSADNLYIQYVETESGVLFLHFSPNCLNNHKHTIWYYTWYYHPRTMVFAMIL